MSGEKSVNNKYVSIFISAALIMMIGVLSLPSLRSGVYEGHDLVFHLGRIKEIASELQSGQFPVRYEYNAWYGYGYITSTMYPNFFLYIPAVLYIMGLPLYRAYNIYVVIINIISVGIGYYSFRRIFRSANWGLLADVIYCFSAYRFANLYRRAAVGEYTAMAFIPLLIYGIYKLYYEKENQPLLRRISPIVIAMFGIIESHILTTEMLALFVVLFGIFNIKKTVSLWKEIMFSVVLILLTNAFFLIPFIDTYIHEDMMIANSAWDASGEGLYISQFFKPFSEGRGSDLSWSPEHEEFLALGIAIVLCFIATFIFFICYRKLICEIIEKESMVAIIQIFALGVLAGWISTIYFPWEHLTGDGAFAKLMCAVQFPWRYLLIMTICFVITGVYSMKALYEYLLQNKAESIIRKYYIKFLCIVFAVIAILQAGIFYHYLSYASETIRDESVLTGWPDYVDALYLLNGTDKQVIREELDLLENEEFVTLPLLGYNHIEIYNPSGDSIDWTRGYNNRVVISKSDYTEGIYNKFVEPMLWSMSVWISIITVIVYIVCIHLINRKQRKVKNG